MFSFKEMIVQSGLDYLQGLDYCFEDTKLEACGKFYSAYSLLNVFQGFCSPSEP